MNYSNIDRFLLLKILEYLPVSQINTMSLVNKHFYKVVKNIYYKNKFRGLLYEFHNPLMDRKIPALRLTWHLVWKAWTKKRVLCMECRNHLFPKNFDPDICWQCHRIICIHCGSSEKSHRQRHGCVTCSIRRKKFGIRCDRQNDSSESGSDSEIDWYFEDT